jgi:hypothetical protein
MVKIVSPLLSSNTYGLLVLTKKTKCPNLVFYVWLGDLQTTCAKKGLETFFSPNDGFRKYLLDMKHGWTKNAFWDVNNKKWRKWCYFVSPFLFKNTFGLPVLTNVQIKYFIFDWSFYKLFVLNRVWKHDSLQIMIFECVSSTWSIVELKTRFDPWLTGNDVNDVRFFHISYLITLMAYLCNQKTPNV